MSASPKGTQNTSLNGKKVYGTKQENEHNIEFVLTRSNLDYIIISIDLYRSMVVPDYSELNMIFLTFILTLFRAYIYVLVRRFPFGH